MMMARKDTYVQDEGQAGMLHNKFSGCPIAMLYHIIPQLSEVMRFHLGFTASKKGL